MALSLNCVHCCHSILYDVYIHVCTLIVAVWYLVDTLSVQLTTPSKPLADVSLTDINNVISGKNSAPWAVQGVANELGVLSVVADTWRTNNKNVSDYIVRR